MKSIISEIDEVNNNIRYLKDNYKTQNNKLTEQISKIKSDVNIALIAEKTLRGSEDDKLSKELENQSAQLSR